MSLEIERKFVLTKQDVRNVFDHFQLIDTQIIIQGYFLTMDDFVEHRIRLVIDQYKNLKYFLTIKTNSCVLNREEYQFEIDNKFGESMLLKDCTKLLLKVRNTFKLTNDLNLELNYFDNYDLHLGEVEFKDLNQAQMFDSLFLGDEVVDVTNDDNFKNFNLAISNNFNAENIDQLIQRMYENKSTKNI